MEEQNLFNKPDSDMEAPVSHKEQLQQIIQSGENIQQQSFDQLPFKVKYAGFWVRFAASFVDGLILIIPLFLLGLVLGLLGTPEFVNSILGYFLAWTYAIYMLNNHQATLGKMALGLKVTTANGSKPIIGKLALREILGKFINVVTLCIGYIIIAFTEKKQGLHDMMADTVVVYDTARKSRPWLVVVCIIFGLIVPLAIGIWVWVIFGKLY